MKWLMKPQNGRVSTSYFDKFQTVSTYSWQHCIEVVRNECFDKKSDPVVDHDDANDIYNCKGA